MAPGRVCNNSSYLTSIQTRNFGVDNADLYKALNQLIPANTQYESNSQNPIDGDFERGISSLRLPQRFINWLDAIASFDLPNQDNIRTLATVSALRLYLWYIQTLGRFHSEIKQYGQAALYNNLAKRIYDALFDRNMRAVCIEPLSSGRVDRQIINHALNNRHNRRAIVEFLYTKGKEPIAMLKLGYAELLQSMIRADQIVPDAWVERTISPKELQASIGGRLVGPLGTVRGNLEQAGRYSQSILSMDQSIIQIKIKRAQDRVNIVEANHRLESAKRLRVKNHALALENINKALKLCTGSDDPEVGVSSELTKAWAYSSLANLKDEKERGSGREEALKAAEIYKKIFDSTSEKYLQRLAMSRLEIYLSYADNLKLAQKYDQAVSAYEKVLKGGYPARQIVYDRAKLGKISAQVAKADYDYFKAGDSVKALSIFEKTSQDARKLLSQIQGMENGSFTGKQYRAEIVKLKDTLAWAEASKGRIERAEKGGGKEYFETAKKLYADIGEGLDLNTQIETGMTKAQLSMRQGGIYKDLKEYDLALNAYRKVKPEDIVYNKSRIEIIPVLAEKIKRAYPNNGDFNKALSRLQKILAYADSISASKFSETEKISHKLVLSQVNGTIGWLKILALQRDEAKLFFAKATQAIKDLLGQLNRMDANKREALLDNVYQTEAQLKLAVADIEKVSGERDVERLNNALHYFSKAIDSFSKNPGTVKSRQGIIQSKIGKIEAIAMRVKLLSWEHEYGKALYLINALLNSGLIKDTVVKIKELEQSNHPNINLAFRFYQTLAMVLGIKGGLSEKTKGEGAGADDFKRAREAYEIADSITQKYKGVLLANEVTESSLLLSKADLLKAEGLKSIKTLISSLSAYKKIIALSPKPEHPLYHLSMNDRIKAGIGSAEAYISIGKLLEENHYDEGTVNMLRQELGAKEDSNQDRLAERAYAFASQLAASSVKFLGSGRGALDLPRAAMGLRGVKAFTGALGSLGAIRENLAGLQQEADPELLGEYKIALLTHYLLLKEKDNEPDEETDKLIKEVKQAAFNKANFAEAFGQRKLNFQSVVDFINSQRIQGTGDKRSVLTDSEVYFNTDTSPWNLLFSYIGFQIAARFYKGALNSYEEARKSFLSRKSFAIGDKRFLADIHSAMGDLYAFRLREYTMAGKSYEWASQQISELPRLLRKTENIAKIERRLLFGEAKILIEEKEYHKALLKYQNIFVGLKLQTKKAKEQEDIGRAYLSRGDVYSYHIKDAGKAIEEYGKARNFLSGLSKTIPLRTLLAQSYLGSGDVYRLRELDYPAAITQYLNGIKLAEHLSSRLSKKVLSQLYTGLAESYKKLGNAENRNRAEESLKLARASIKQCRNNNGNGEKCSGLPYDAYDLDRNDIEDRVEGGYVNFRTEKFEKSALSARAAYRQVWGEFSGRPENGDELEVGISSDIFRGHQLGLQYTAEMIKRKILFENDLRERLIGGPGHSLLFGHRYTKEWDKINLAVSSSLRFGVTDFKTYQYKWGRNYPEYESKTEQSRQLVTISPSVSAEVSYKWAPSSYLLFMPGLGARGSFMGLMGENAGVTETIDQLEKPVDKRKGVEPGKSILGAASGYGTIRAIVPHIRLGDNVRLSNLRAALGGMFSFDEIDTSAKGFWKLTGEVPLWRSAGVLDFGGSINFGSNYEWMLFLESHHEIGRTFPQGLLCNYHQGKIGGRYYPWGIEAAMGLSYFSLGDSQRSTALTISFGLSF